MKRLPSRLWNKLETHMTDHEISQLGLLLLCMFFLGATFAIFWLILFPGMNLYVAFVLYIALVILCIAGAKYLK